MNGERLWAALVSTLVLGAVAWPAVHGRDSFPLSTYPMFSKPKSATAEVYHVVAHSTERRHRPVPPALVGTDEIMQAFQTIKIAIRSGESDPLCAEIAARVARRPEYVDIDRLEVRIDTFDTVGYFSGDRRPQASEVFAVCSVPRGDAR